VKVRNFAGAIAVAALLALPLIKPVIAGIDTWKIVLGTAGLILFVTAGMSRAEGHG
jgi:ABC-type Fe3+ transport system permease subunit